MGFQNLQQDSPCEVVVVGVYIDGAEAYGLLPTAPAKTLLNYSHYLYLVCVSQGQTHLLVSTDTRSMLRIDMHMHPRSHSGRALMLMAGALP